ncbi:MAG: response regulator [Dehalococcoidia bacterium]|nr:response regulator [Dehalococcoidia bacterium]
MPDERSSSNNPRILVVDDEDAVRGVLVRALGLWGYDVEAAPDGETALAHFSPSPARYACVLLDLTMPGIGGEATYREIKHLNEDLPIVLMSGYAPDDTIQGLAAHPPAAFLQKPFDLATLRQLIEVTLQR